MAKNKLTENNTLNAYPSVGWVCDSCGKTVPLTDEEAENAERPKPNTKPEDWDYYIPCPLCKTGQVQQPTFSSLADALASVFSCEEE